MTFTALILSGIVAANPTTPTPWFNMEDYPVRAFERRHEGASGMEVVVAPDGRPTRCTIAKSSGSSILDDRACEVTMNRIRFTPAKSDDGQAVYGTYRTQVNWALEPENWSQSEFGPDLEVSLSKLPDGSTAPVSMKYAVAVSASGQATACAPLSQGPKILGDLGCTKVMQDLRPAPVTDKAGNAVDAVKTAWVTFTN